MRRFAAVPMLVVTHAMAKSATFIVYLADPLEAAQSAPSQLPS
ncbi:MAG: hypothetical protein PUK59_07685 [Actinomycetaceae bacterium]|nr:hypothetical protein [Actinomycetaceae bacterium]MDY5854343.1 hypothetical protein [Arcanobacterium sp.]